MGVGSHKVIVTFWKEIRSNLKRTKIARTKKGNAEWHASGTKANEISSSVNALVNSYTFLCDWYGNDLSNRNTYQRLSWTCASLGPFPSTSCTAARSASFIWMPSKTWLQIQRDHEIKMRLGRPRITSCRAEYQKTKVYLKSSTTTVPRILLMCYHRHFGHIKIHLKSTSFIDWVDAAQNFLRCGLSVSLDMFLSDSYRIGSF